MHTAPTLPESEVFRLCVAGRDGRVMADLKTEHVSKDLFYTQMLRFGQHVSISSPGHLLADIVEASVFPVTLVGFSQDRVEGFVAIPPGSPGISRDRECCHINLGIYIFDHYKWTCR